MFLFLLFLAIVLTKSSCMTHRTQIETEEVQGKKRKKNRTTSITETNEEPEFKKIKAVKSVPTTDDSRKEASGINNASDAKQKKKKKRKETPLEEVENSSNIVSGSTVKNGPLSPTVKSEKKNIDSNLITVPCTDVQAVGASSLPRKKKKKKNSVPGVTIEPNAVSIGGDATAKRKKKKKKKKKNGKTSMDTTATQNTGTDTSVQKKKTIGKKPIRESQGVDASIVQSMSDERLKLYGFSNPKKFKQAARFGFGKKDSK